MLPQRAGYERQNYDFVFPTQQQILQNQNQQWYQDRIRKDNLDLRFENNNIIEDTRFNLGRQNLTIFDQQVQHQNQNSQIQQLQSFIKDLEYKLNDSQKFNTSNEQEVYRMRIKYSEMTTQLEKVIKDKDQIIYDSRKKISDLVSEKASLQEQFQIMDDEIRKMTNLNKEMFEKIQAQGKQKNKGAFLGQGGTQGDEKHTDMLKKDYETQIKELQARIQDMYLENEKLNKVIEELKESNRILSIKKEKEVQQQIQEEQKQEKISKDLLNLPIVAEAERIKKRNTELVDEIQKLKIRNEELESDSNEKVMEIDVLRRKLKEAEQLRKMQQEEEKLRLSKQTPLPVQATSMQQSKNVLQTQSQAMQQSKSPMQKSQAMQQSRLPPEQTSNVGQNTNASQNKENEKKQADDPQQQMIIKVCEDRNLLDGVLGLIHYVRESICEMIFEIFVRSANQAYQSRNNSYIIFSLNLRELREKNIKGFIIVLFMYKKMKQLLKMYFPDYGKVLFNNYTTKNGDKQAPLVAAQLDNQNVGTWIDQQMNMIKFRKIHQDKDDENKDLLYMFRILSIRYRIKFPMKGSEFNLEKSLQIRLENKICSALLQCFVDSIE